MAKLQHRGPDQSIDVGVIILNKTPFGIVTFTKEQEQRINQNYDLWNASLTRWFSDARDMVFGLGQDTMEFRHSMAQAFFGPVRPIRTEIIPAGVRGFYVVYSEKVAAGLKKLINEKGMQPEKVVKNAARIMTEGLREKESQLAKFISS